MRVRRLDVGRIDKPSRTPQGGLRASAYVTRAGIFKYTRADGSLQREYRSMAEVSRADSLASLASAPVTFRHPPGMVNPENFREYARGQVGESVKMDGDKVSATLYVQDGELLQAIERGDAREVSCGYTCDVVVGAGVVPEGEPDAGEKYDAAQINIAYNHAAVVETGRAGREVALRLDGEGHVISPADAVRGEENMKVEKIDGVEYEIGTPAHKAAEDRRDAAAKAAKEAATALQVRADAAEAELKKAKADLAEAPKRAAAALAARAALETEARKILGADVKFDGKSDDEIRSATVSKIDPAFKLDAIEKDQRAVYLRGRFDAALLSAETRSDGNDDVLEATERTDETEQKKDDKRFDAQGAHDRMVERNRNAWKVAAPAASDK